MAHLVAIINGKVPSGGVGGVSDADLSNIAVNFLTAGVVAVDDYKVEEQSTPNMTVKVNTGKAYVRNAAGTMAYQIQLDASVNATIGNNSSGSTRVDAVVLKVDLGVTPNNLASNVASIVVVPGTVANTAPTDSAIQTAVGSGNPFYRLANVTVANGAASITNSNISSTRARVSISGGSKVLQVVFGQQTTQQSSTSSVWTDTGLTATITPSSPTSKILVIANHGESQADASGTYLGLRLIKGATPTVLSEFSGNQGSSNGGALNMAGGSASYLDEPATTSPVTYKTQFRRSSGAGTVRVQQNSSMSTITLMEIAA